jgi:hypothetical protein
MLKMHDIWPLSLDEASETTLHEGVVKGEEEELQRVASRRIQYSMCLEPRSGLFFLARG